ncbi:hypothetical protein DAETH_37830 (plasmid) [Deinococcus aetherius]|uniref:Uncharacterized protein n=1 Tax=Deinococcus aetherius TaxID=200252 RepID=A0ABN6RPM4_9DEIO|nr:hypothetical protein [Deinococcus aetherius]BDP43814.1 hypothetical protein DAETH_37830 [Deinococcus aetherius]
MDDRGGSHLPTYATNLLGRGQDLERYRDVVSDLARGRGTLTEDEGAELTRRMEQFLPDAPLASWIAPGGSAVAAELARRGVPDSA